MNHPVLSGNWPKQLALFDLPLPPLAEQQRIAAYLDASCAAIDRAVETKRKQLETLDALRKSIIQKAVTQGLNPKVKMKESPDIRFPRVPQHWTVRKLRYEISIRSGSFVSDLLDDSGKYPVFGSSSQLGMANETNLESEAIIIGRVGACGVVQIVSGPCLVSDNAMIIQSLHHTKFMGLLL